MPVLLFEASSDDDDRNDILYILGGNKSDKKNSSLLKVPLPTVSLIIDTLKDAGIRIGHIECHNSYPLKLSDLCCGQEGTLKRSWDINVWAISNIAVMFIYYYY